jgi:hypothetical protein
MNRPLLRLPTVQHEPVVNCEECRGLGRVRA